MPALQDASATLTELAKTHDACLSFFSGGKDSLACMDLCVRHFRRVVGVFMYLVPGLAVAEERLDYARKRWSIDFLCVPHWLLSRFLRRGIYCFPRKGVREVTLSDVTRGAREGAGIDLCAVGRKRSDSLWARRSLSRRDERVVYPLEGWNKFDVLAYLARRDIPAPDKFDLDLSPQCVLWLHDEHPDDFRKLCEVFPHAEALAWRRRLYGQEASA